MPVPGPASQIVLYFMELMFPVQATWPLKFKGKHGVLSFR